MEIIWYYHGEFSTGWLAMCGSHCFFGSWPQDFLAGWSMFLCVQSHPANSKKHKKTYSYTLIDCVVNWVELQQLINSLLRTPDFFFAEMVLICWLRFCNGSGRCCYVRLPEGQRVDELPLASWVWVPLKWGWWEKFMMDLLDTIWLFNIANWTIHSKWRFLAGKIIGKWAMASIAMLNNQRVMLMIDILLHIN